MRDLRQLDHLRAVTVELDLYGLVGGSGEGAFWVVSDTSGLPLAVIASSGGGWDHVSVSLPDRCPSWDEMEQVKRLFFEDHETAMQLHVPVADHISTHPYALHVWAPHDGAIPRPPTWMVGPWPKREGQAAPGRK